MTPESVGAVLCNEPFNRTPEDLLKLTPRQVLTYYLCDRTKDGRVELQTRPDAVAAEVPDDKRIYAEWARLNAIPDWLRDREFPEWVKTKGWS